MCPWCSKRLPHLSARDVRGSIFAGHSSAHVVSVPSHICMASISPGSSKCGTTLTLLVTQPTGSSVVTPAGLRSKPSSTVWVRSIASMMYRLRRRPLIGSSWTTKTGLNLQSEKCGRQHRDGWYRHFEEDHLMLFAEDVKKVDGPQAMVPAPGRGVPYMIALLIRTTIYVDTADQTEARLWSRRVIETCVGA